MDALLEREAREEDAATLLLRRAAGRAGLAGCLPFLVLSLWLAGIAAGHPWHDATIALLTQYAAVVLSFLGGVRWGLAAGSGSGRPAAAIAAGLVPPAAGWAALWVPLPYTFAVLAAAFAAQGAWDAFAVHGGTAPSWYGRLRGWLTAVAVAALVIAFLATA